MVQEIYRPLLQLSVDEFSELVEKERVRRLPIESRLFHKLSTRHRLAYVEAISHGAAILLSGQCWNIIIAAALFRTISAG